MPPKQSTRQKMRRKGLSDTAKRRAQRAAQRTLVVVPGVTSGAPTQAGDDVETLALGAFMAECGQRTQTLVEKLASEQRSRQRVQSQLRYERSAADAAEAAANDAEKARAAAEREALAQVAAARLANEQLRERLAVEKVARQQSERDLKQLQAKSAVIVELEARATKAERARAGAEAALQKAEEGAEAARLATIDAKAACEALRYQLVQQSSKQVESALLTESAEEDDKQSGIEAVKSAAPAAVVLDADSDGTDASNQASDTDKMSTMTSNHGSGAENVDVEGSPVQPELQNESGPVPTTSHGTGTIASARVHGPVADFAAEQKQKQQAQGQNEAKPAPISLCAAETENQRLNAMVADGLQKLLVAEGSARDALCLHANTNIAHYHRAVDPSPSWTKRTGGLLGKDERWTKRAPYGTRPARVPVRAQDATVVQSTELALYRLGAEVRQLWHQFDQQSNRPRRRVL